MIFLAEIVLALAVILNLYRLDRSVIKLSKQFLCANSLIKPIFFDIREFLAELTRDINEFAVILGKKRDEYFLKSAKTLLAYLLIFSLKGKYKKTFIACQFAKEIYEGCFEA